MRCAALALLAAAPLCAASDAQQLARSITIYRDTYDVPHIRAKIRQMMADRKTAKTGGAKTAAAKPK